MTSLLRSARKWSGLTQAEVAAAAGLSQPVVSIYERGLRDPTLGTLRRLLAGTDHTLVVDAARRVGGPGYVPMSAADLAQELVGVSRQRRKRLVLEFLRGHQEESVSDRRGLIADTPPSVDPAWDALLAACAEHLAVADADRAPAWCFESSGFLAKAWFWDDVPSLRRRALLTAPASFRRRNVWIDRSELEAV